MKRLFAFLFAAISISAVNDAGVPNESTYLSPAELSIIEMLSDFNVAREIADHSTFQFRCHNKPMCDVDKVFCIAMARCEKYLEPGTSL